MLQAPLSSALRIRQRHVTPSGESLRHRQVRVAIDLTVSYVFGVAGDHLRSGRRGVRDVAEARQVAMYLAHVCCRMSLTEVGTMFGRDRTTVAHACLKVECRRDDPNFDRALDVLSWALPTLVHRQSIRDRTKARLEMKDHEWL